ncbi:helix-turn-helix domain-containing protein (plasmid) [Alicyclobacillus fastidiosus]|uniref:Helix-turn-helix domain-containing protein n=1 Tax=Alicyclobacillus fastidiosus TaxID=392011 RepID=A0ABY6ZPR5_9BACL|nr:helix-turn-helix domain-containing protein [Alicyclobacillus fastidiosus]WAH44814.1 helix-turn-helix domain-containing protein [Alicyclobacillus fastidiosus]GMA65775.1 hypothetical protein GCM10025859_62150 [Alicyclobacillus fastidiosus]
MSATAAEINLVGTVYENGYGDVSQMVMRDKNLSGPARLIYAYLCTFAGGNLEDERIAWPSVSTILEELDMSQNTFYKHRKQLIEAGYIECWQENHGQFQRTMYRIVKEAPYLKNYGTDRIAKIEVRQSTKTAERKICEQNTNRSFTTTITKTNTINTTTTTNTEPNEATKPSKRTESKSDSVVVSDIDFQSLGSLRTEIESRLGVSIRSLIPKLGQWLTVYGREYIIEKAEYISIRGDWNNLLGAFRRAVEDNWTAIPNIKGTKTKRALVDDDLAAIDRKWEEEHRANVMQYASNAVQKPIHDERYANFYKLFPDY